MESPSLVKTKQIPSNFRQVTDTLQAPVTSTVKSKKTSRHIIEQAHVSGERLHEIWYMENRA